MTAPVHLLAVDPSLTCTGWARFFCGSLQGCGLIRPDRGDPFASRVSLAGHAFRGVSVDILVIEWPQVYRATRSKGDPNDLLAVAGVAGGVLSQVTALQRTLTPKPAEWKGQVPKEIHNARVLARLDDAERALVDGAGPASLLNNAIDAVGLGLWALGRMASHVQPGTNLRGANEDQEAHGTPGVAPRRGRARRG